MNYLGDWGKQYGVLAVGFERFGSEERLELNPIGHLFDVYVEISKLLKIEEDEVKQKQERIEDFQVSFSRCSKQRLTSRLLTWCRATTRIRVS